MLAVKCGKMVNKDGKVVENTVIIVDDGRIAEVGNDVKIPENSDVIDAASLWVTPGLIEAHCHAAGELADLNEITSPVNPDERAFDAISPFMEDIPKIRNAGFTTVCVLPGSANLIGGSGVVLKIKQARTVDEMAVYGKEPFKMAMGENPKRVHGMKGKLPSTRMGNLALARRMFIKAQDYMKQKEAGNLEKTDTEMEALLPVIKGEKRVHIHCHEANDLVNTVKFAREFELDFTMDHVSQGAKIADWLSENKVLCIVGPLLAQSIKKETDGRHCTLPGVLERAGVEFALTSDEDYGIAYLPMAVGHYVGYGLSWEMGMRSITINAAKALQIDDRVGSLEAGKDADMAFFNGDPLLNTTRCVGTMIDGKFYNKSF